VLEYVEGELRTRANGDLKDQIGRPTEAGHIGIVDPSCSLLGFHLYDGHFKVIPLSEDGTLSQAINVRLEELKVIDINFLYETEHPTIAVLYEDTKEQRNVKTYQLSPDFQELEEGPWSESHVDQGSTMLIPVPGSNGCIIVGEKKIQFFSSSDSSVVSIAPSLVKSYSKVGSDGTRYLLGDIFGNLLLLAIEGVNGRRLRIEKLGETSQASSLCYLDSGVVFVGSALGDSQLVKLHSNKLATGNYTELVDTMPNLGPIVDFAVVDLDRQGQGQVLF
jgi:DNA damage-binding protein 1